ncbi:hypothetical protein BDP27DRAFT_1481940 [Rhodocollybia butyracea]|uniref:Uncharacterized protein n=1 Tax=Rhodocollybia butyracea TaxID=206335 RepID=A0A9P5PBM3_9AGAR|nr:hypothetical protein BDP27DRAFT_1481940 [Rhodocollybia butyracea]
MKRGFLTTSKSKERIDKAIPDSNTPVLPKFSKLSHGVVPEADYKSQFNNEYKEFSADTLNYSKEVAVYTSIPSRGYDDKPGDIPAYSIKELEQADRKGLGLFATRLIRAGDLVVDERPMLVVPAGSAIPLPESAASYSPEQQKQVFLHEWGKLVKTAFDRMSVDHKGDFMALANSHQHDGSEYTTDASEQTVFKSSMDPILRSAKIFRVLITAVAQTLSSAGTPNPSLFASSPSATSPPNSEITLSYCDTLNPAADRAKALAPYGIHSCICTDTGLSCFDPARSKIGDTRRSKFANDIIVLTPPFEKPPPGTPKDAWVEPALARFRELEEEGQQGTEQFKTTAHQLVNVYAFLQDVEKALFYARKLKGVYEFFEMRELETVYLSETGIRGSHWWKMGDMHKMGAPMLMSFA